MNNINEKLNELIDLLKNQDEVIYFNQIEDKLKANQFINEKLNQFRKMQQKHVLYENKNGKVPVDVNSKYENLQNELFEIPVFNEYLNLLNDINDVIQSVAFIIESEINSGLNRISE
ncbi:MAG: hypothetical protein K0Q49_1126 [Haloplasmataceae bacterium]|jgi:cell fate (sporulation/competence/biofilm development) regulator YmcA (YheA/YmcA/DUF963 family)|nr:hypothetical protein [Haloplasmataceae bacterium]